MKAEAFANAGWQLHWARHGPGLLSQGWRAAYPHVPLEKIQTLCGIDFLCHDMDGLGMRLSEEQDSVGAIDSVGKGLGTGHHPSANEPAASTDVVMAGSHGRTDVVMVGTTETTCSPQHGEQGVCSSEEDIANTWNDFYNCMYWHCFQCYKYEIGTGVEDVGGAVQEEEAEPASEGALGKESVDTRLEEDESRSSPVVSVLCGGGGTVGVGTPMWGVQWGTPMWGGGTVGTPMWGWEPLCGGYSGEPLCGGGGTVGTPMWGGGPLCGGTVGNPYVGGSTVGTPMWGGGTPMWGYSGNPYVGGTVGTPMWGGGPLCGGTVGTPLFWTLLAASLHTSVRVNKLSTFTCWGTIRASLISGTERSSAVMAVLI